MACSFTGATCWVRGFVRNTLFPKVLVGPAYVFSGAYIKTYMWRILQFSDVLDRLAPSETQFRPQNIEPRPPVSPQGRDALDQRRCARPSDRMYIHDDNLMTRGACAGLVTSEQDLVDHAPNIQNIILMKLAPQCQRLPVVTDLVCMHTTWAHRRPAEAARAPAGGLHP